ncbi:uncharacterized protein LOC108032577 [Drosophila biarmipes]|uniref:uncharacterized protein LOC108032577 n=1 Tax=Drosophila biarmipes TaxID=125945 RepID=UPI0007E6C767|nr:uncharacterized protein LOC108032577 [Drosophila biarmipes]
MSSLPTKSWSIQLRELVTSPFAIIALTCVLGYVTYIKTRRQHGTYDDEDYEREGHRKLPAPLTGLRLNRKQLAKYNSERPDKTYLVALLDVIYDVSSAAHDFGPGGKYAKLSGTEVTGFIKKQAFFEMRDYETYLTEWQMMLEDFFYPAGKLIDGEREVFLEGKVKVNNMKDIEEKDKEEEKELTQEPEVKPELIPEPIPELPDLDLGPPDEAINSDCDSLRTAYDFPPGQDDRLDELNDEDDEKDANDKEDFPKAGQEDNDGNAPTDEAPNQTIWNDTDVTMVATS